MKNYFRLLSYAKPLGSFLIPFIFTSLLASIFGVLNIAMLIPVLNVLFDQVSLQTGASSSIFIEKFNFYLYKFLTENGKQGALLYVCGVLSVTVVLSNIFKYWSVRLLEGFKANMVANLRQAVFNNSLGLHLGFFNNERKGNLISRVVTDVQEVELFRQQSKNYFCFWLICIRFLLFHGILRFLLYSSFRFLAFLLLRSSNG
jgi:ATP-binding cassette, subfamily B, bacterial MsbA